jgi:hypothetical protein
MCTLHPMVKKVTQQEFLRAAMTELGRLQGLERSLTREEFCARLSCPVTTFNKWMLVKPPADSLEKSTNARDMPTTMWAHIREVIAHESLKKKVNKRVA